MRSAEPVKQAESHHISLKSAIICLHSTQAGRGRSTNTESGDIRLAQHCGQTEANSRMHSDLLYRIEEHSRPQRRSDRTRNRIRNSRRHNVDYVVLEGHVDESKRLPLEEPPPSRRDTSAELNNLTNYVAKSRQHFVDESPPWSRFVVNRGHSTTSHLAERVERVWRWRRFHRLIDTNEETDRPRGQLAAMVKERSHEEQSRFTAGR